jgi:hypothetical protein
MMGMDDSLNDRSEGGGVLSGGGCGDVQSMLASAALAGIPKEEDPEVPFRVERSSTGGAVAAERSR